MLSSSPELQILLLEDAPADVELMREALRKSGITAALHVVDRREEYMKALEERRPDLILADHGLPAFHIGDALQLARHRYSDVPFIFVSGSVGEERAVEAIKEGATDYVLKDHLMRLGPAVQRAVEESRHRRERIRSDETLRLILANALDAVVTMNRSGLVQGWNPQAERIFGWTAEEAIDRPLADLIIPERLRGAHWRGLERYLSVGEGPILGHRAEMPALHRDGHEFPVELTVTPIVQGAETWFSAFIRDISAPRRLSARLSVEHAVAKILAEAADARSAISAILQAMSRGLEWEVANFWRLDPARHALVLEETWSADPARFGAFVDVCRTLAFGRGKGLPGRVWAARAAAWSSNHAVDDSDPPSLQAGAAGLRGALAFPVREGGDLLGVIEVFSLRETPPDSDLLEVLDALGSQIGQFLKRQKNEAAIRDTEQQLRLITDALPSLIAYVDRDRRFVFVNRAYKEWVGLSPEEMLGKPVAAVLGQEGYEAIRPFIERALSGERTTYETLVPFRNGMRRWVEGKYVPDVKPDGSVAGFFSLVTDVTPRKEAEESAAFLSEATGVLASSLDYEDTLAAIAQLAVPRIADWSSIFLRVDGKIQPLAVVHQDPAKAVKVKDLLQSLCFDRELHGGGRDLLQSGRSLLVSEVTEALLVKIARTPEELTVLRELGLQSILAVPMIVTGGTVAALTLASSASGRHYGPEDLRFAEELARRAALAMENSRLYREVRHESDERRRALEAVRDLNEHLERRVRERTGKLEEITRELDSFASTVAHDLRAPLRVMKGFSEMLLEDYSGKVLDPAGQEYARKIDRASLRMTVLVEDLLAYSRLSRDEVPIRPVDLEASFDEVLLDMTDEIRAANADLTVQRPLPRAMGHGALMMRVLANLLGNAVKFVVPGTTPKVSVRAEGDGPDHVRLWIEDNGIGIEPEFQDRIFGVFERLHSQELYPGTGLGLAIVRRAVERMGGSVGVASVPGEGSRFWIRLRRPPDDSRPGM